MTQRGSVTADRYPWCDDVKYDTVEEWSQAMRRSRTKRELVKYGSRVIGAAVVIMWLWVIGATLRASGVGFKVIGAVMVFATLCFFVVFVLAWMMDDDR